MVVGTTVDALLPPAGGDGVEAVASGFLPPAESVLSGVTVWPVNVLGPFATVAEGKADVEATGMDILLEVG